jgi:hypothetical protein
MHLLSIFLPLIQAGALFGSGRPGERSWDVRLELPIEGRSVRAMDERGSTPDRLGLLSIDAAFGSHLQMSISDGRDRNPSDG